MCGGSGGKKFKGGQDGTLGGMDMPKPKVAPAIKPGTKPKSSSLSRSKSPLRK